MCFAVNGKTAGENVDDAEVSLPEVIRPLETPVFREGLYVLHGNLADSAVVRPTVVSREMFNVTGPARVFEGMEECLEALREHKIHPGDMIVLRYEGPKGGPGLPDVFKVMGYLVALELLVSEEELAKRRKVWKPRACRARSGLLTLYAKMALPATEGAGISLRIDE